MKAVVYDRYGSPDILEFKEVEMPVPKDNEVLVKIHASSVNAADWRLLRADPFLVRLSRGFFRPKYPILGCDIAGSVEAVGPHVRQFQPGDEVYGDLSEVGYGGFAEYKATPESELARKPTNATFEEAAAVPLAAATALQGLRNNGQIQPGESVLINGASGGVSTFAVQIAKHFGAEVTAVCSTRKMELARSLGADHVIDYTQEDFTQSGKQYDLILGVNGYQPLPAYQRALRPNGIYVMVGGSGKQLFQTLIFGPWYSRNSDKKLGALTAKPSQKDLITLKEMIEAGRVKPVIDRRYPLREVPDAIRYVEQGHATGKVVIHVP